jgi:hypothetical protein
MRSEGGVARGELERDWFEDKAPKRREVEFRHVASLGLTPPQMKRE